MVIEFKPLNEEAPLRLDDDTLQQIIRKDAGALTNRLTELDQFRDYYEGDQDLNFSTQEFIDTFGTQFADLRSNWMTVVIEAMEERLDVQRIRMRDDLGQVEDELSDDIWRVLLENEMEQLQNDIFNGALVEGRSYALVWPDDLNPDIPRVDFQPAQNMIVTYHPEDIKVIDRAVKRWVTPDGGQRLTIYTRDFLYKYKLDPTGSVDPDDVTPRDTGWQQLDIAESADPAWPLPNPFGEVPIVEFWNRSNRSELRDLMPLQDALNKTMRDMMIANEFQAQNIIYIITSNEEPTDGWKASPGVVWHIQPEVDFEGKEVQTTVGTIQASNPDNFIATLETFLQHIATISRTPAHYFYLSSKQGGRGDAPSGEALRVAETGLLKKVQKSQELWGLRWMRVARLITMALGNFDPEVPLTGDTVWTHPMAHFQSILLEEGRQMISDLGLPPQLAWRHIGLTEEEIDEALAEGFDRNRDEVDVSAEPAEPTPADPDTPAPTPIN